MHKHEINKCNQSAVVSLVALSSPTVKAWMTFFFCFFLAFPSKGQQPTENGSATHQLRTTALQIDQFAGLIRLIEHRIQAKKKWHCIKATLAFFLQSLEMSLLLSRISTNEIRSKSIKTTFRPLTPEVVINSIENLLWQVGHLFPLWANRVNVMSKSEITCTQKNIVWMELFKYMYQSLFLVLPAEYWNRPSSCTAWCPAPSEGLS